MAPHGVSNRCQVLGVVRVGRPDFVRSGKAETHHLPAARFLFPQWNPASWANESSLFRQWVSSEMTIPLIRLGFQEHYSVASGS